MSHVAVAPMTKITKTPTSVEEMRDRIRGSQREHSATIGAFHRLFYECNHTWTFTEFLGVSVMKNPADLWVYQELLTQARPMTILETGSAYGGSALWYACLMDLLGLPPEATVISVDLERRQTCAHPRIVWVTGDSTDPALAADVLAQVTHPLLVTLDADHSEAHVTKELALYAPAVKVGEYLIVEDTNVGWVDIDRGPMGALCAFLTAHPGEWGQDILCERFLTSFAPGGWLRRLKECPSMNSEVACVPQ